MDLIYFFYMNWNSKYALLIETSTLITYLIGILIERSNKIEDKVRKEIMGIFKFFFKFTYLLSVQEIDITNGKIELDSF